MAEDSHQAGRYSLALEEARRALDHQATEVTSVRGRITGLVSAGGLAAAFLGGFAAEGDDPSPWTWLGIAAFVLLVGVAVAVLWPKRFVFAQRADDLAAWAYAGDTITEMERNLAHYMRRHYRSNAKRIDDMTDRYVLALVLLLVEIVALLIDLRGN